MLDVAELVQCGKMGISTQRIKGDNMDSRGYDWGCSRDSVLKRALEINDVGFLVGEVKHNNHLYWRREVLSEAIVMILKKQGMKPQELVKQFLFLAGQGNLECLYRIKALSKKSIDTLIKKGDLILSAESRLREDDREMVYWTTVRLSSPLENALK